VLVLLLGDVRVFQPLEVLAIRAGLKILAKWKWGSGTLQERNWIVFPYLAVEGSFTFVCDIAVVGKEQRFSCLFATVNAELLLLPFWESVGGGQCGDPLKVLL